LCIVINFKHVF
jgi:chitinase